MNGRSRWTGKTVEIIGLAGVMLMAGCAATARAVALTEQPSVNVPVNMNVPARHRDTVERMWLASPTFRRQCARIEQAGDALAVEFRDQPGSSSRMPGVRAWTDIESRSGGHRHTATVFLKIEYREQLVELIAHEMEHVLEWLDGVNYATPGHGHAVKHSAEGAVETIRATTIGRQVAREVIAGVTRTVIDVSREPIAVDPRRRGI